MEVIAITRSFKYNGITLADPNPSLSPDQIREFYGSQYGELNNALVEGPVTKNGVATYTFTRAAGSKGAVRLEEAGRRNTRSAMKPAATEGRARELLNSVLNAEPNPAEQALQQSIGTRNGQTAAQQLLMAVRSNGSVPMPIPSAAFGCWG